MAFTKAYGLVNPSTIPIPFNGTYKLSLFSFYSTICAAKAGTYFPAYDSPVIYRGD